MSKIGYICTEISDIWMSLGNDSGIGTSGLAFWCLDLEYTIDTTYMIPLYGMGCSSTIKSSTKTINEILLTCNCCVVSKINPCIYMCNITTNRS